jgi:hypothetical protein
MIAFFKSYVDGRVRELRISLLKHEKCFVLLSTQAH